ncbi:GDSL-type esterase/lipase family protein [Mangrovibacterium marinum]|uniref:Lysophospholipase L1-like esterase n=1 Tax=Mangrovibacterium marinum TaxID=1639118 RepID=A0A2T5BXZ4_9BACT|nr:GDSL-type esterase/lipase family protein [Mangrovibacterium marinum]PTN06314.1 lysophospholipase L1-like esterase [Mangrovibacterium marinum]
MRESRVILIILLALYVVPAAKAQEAKKWSQSTFYEQRRTLFESLPNTKKEIIFLGNSVTNGGEWAELFQNKRIKNRGISGDVTEGVLFRLNEVTESKPAKVFLLIGINDLARGISKDTVFSNICRIAAQIKADSPKTQLYLQSILPVNPDFGKFQGHCSKTEEILWINQQLSAWCSTHDAQFINLFDQFKNDDNQQMNPRYTNDGLHLLGDGYLLWTKIINQFI